MTPEVWQAFYNESIDRVLTMLLLAFVLLAVFAIWDELRKDVERREKKTKSY